MFSSLLLTKPHHTRSYPIGGEEVNYEEIVVFAKKRTSKMRFADGSDTRRSSLAVSRRRRTSSSGCGSIHAASTSEATQNCPSLSILSTGGMKRYAMRTFTTFTHPFCQTSEMYLNSEGWPEWFSRKWTLQEMMHRAMSDSSTTVGSP